MLSLENLIIYIGTIFWIAGTLYRYKAKRSRFKPGNFIITGIFSFGVSAGLVYTAGCIALIFFDVWMLNFKLGDLKIPALIGSISGTIVTVFYFLSFLREKGKTRH